MPMVARTTGADRPSELSELSHRQGSFTLALGLLSL